jgi:hypothetical protein
MVRAPSLVARVYFFFTVTAAQTRRSEVIRCEQAGPDLMSGSCPSVRDLTPAAHSDSWRDAEAQGQIYLRFPSVL